METSTAPQRWPRDFRLHFSARIAATLGAQSTYVAIPLVALLSFAPAQAALIAAASYLSTLVIGVPAGVLADRLPRRRVMIAAETVQVLAMFLMTITIASGAPSLVLLCMLAFVNGSMFAVFGAASASAIPDLVDRPRLTRALSAVQARDAVIGVIGPIIGAGLVTVASWTPFALAAIGFLASALLIGRISNPLRPESPVSATTEHPKRTSGRRRETALKGLAVIGGSPILRPVVSAQMLLSFVLTGSFFSVVAVLVARGTLVGSGVAAAVMGIGLLLGSVLSRRTAERLAPSSAVLLQAIFWAACMGALGASTAIPGAIGLCLLLLALLLMWVLVPVSRVSIEIWIADHVARAERGRVQSMRGVLNAVASPLGPTVCGLVIASSVGGIGAFIMLAGVSLLAAALSLVAPRLAIHR